MTDDRQQVYEDFGELVNMTPKEIEGWLGTDESKSVGESEDGGESKGRRSAKRILAIKRKRKADLTDDDYDHMRRVRGYVKRHLAQRPEGKHIADSPWRHSLMNWGHDPLK